MKNKIWRILPVLCTALLLGACDSQVDVRKEKMPSEAAAPAQTDAREEDSESLQTEPPETEMQTEYADEAGAASGKGTEKAEQAPKRSETPLSQLAPIPFPAQALPQPSWSMQTLQWELSDMISEWDGRWSIYALNLITDEELSIRDVSMPSASLMKLFIMGAVYQAIEDGILERDSEVMALMSGMICASSNGDANRLLAKLGGGDHKRGIERVNAWIKSQGYSENTHQYNGFQDDSLVFDKKHLNSISARDCARLIEQVYHRQFGSRRVCNEIEDWMLRQGTRYKIPAGINADVQIGNKTGETDDVENDAAIVYAGKCDFILVVLSCGWQDKNAAQKRIQQIARKTYLFLTKQDDAQIRILIPAGIYLLSARTMPVLQE